MALSDFPFNKRSELEAALRDEKAAIRVDVFEARNLATGPLRHRAIKVGGPSRLLIAAPGLIALCVLGVGLARIGTWPAASAALLCFALAFIVGNPWAHMPLKGILLCAYVAVGWGIVRGDDWTLLVGLGTLAQRYAAVALYRRSKNAVEQLCAQDTQLLEQLWNAGLLTVAFANGDVWHRFFRTEAGEVRPNDADPSTVKERTEALMRYAAGRLGERRRTMQ